MSTGELKSKVDRIWDTMWSGGISNPLSVIEPLTYLLFIKCLDELQTLTEAKTTRTKKPIEDPIFDTRQNNLRWSTSSLTIPTAPTHHTNDAMFLMPTPRLLSIVVDQLDEIDMSDSDTKGDLYEYMLSKIASAGQNDQFRTPRHVIRLMLEMTDPTPHDVICDPACGTPLPIGA